MVEESTSGARGRRRGVWIGATAGGLVVVLVAAFLGYGWWSRRGDVEYSRGGEDFLDAEQIPGAPPSSTPTPLPRDASTAPSARPSGPAAATGLPTPLAPLATAVSTKQPTAAPSKAPVAVAPGVARPTPGVYKLAVSGKEGVKFGPLSFCDRTLPAETSMVVAPAKNEPDGSFAFDLRYYPGEPEQHDERQILRYTDSAIAMTYEVGTVTCSGIRQSSEVSYTPVVDRVRFPLKVGASWSGKGGNDKRLESYTTKVARKDVVVVAGRSFPVFVIESASTFTGAESGERRRVWWFSPLRGMPLKWTDFIKGGRSGASFTNDVTVAVTSLPEAPKQKAAMRPDLVLGVSPGRPGVSDGT